MLVTYETLQQFDDFMYSSNVPRSLIDYAIMFLEENPEYDVQPDDLVELYNEQ